jgi:mannose-6-phosphate isomerase-like protein (cupin superfamily)
MKKFKLDNCGDRGWYIGDFDKAAYRTKDFEVNYQENEVRVAPTHKHEKITEIFLVLEGKMKINEELFSSGDIVVLEPGDINKIEYLEHTKTVTVKTPAIPTDKIML